jgi:predicted nucleotidyltransferase
MCEMRVSDRERSAIREAVARHFGADARVLLFGSRTDDDRRGGDIDLYVETDLAPAEANRAKLLTIADVQLAIGEQKIDLVVSPLMDPRGLLRQEIDREAVPL